MTDELRARANDARLAIAGTRGHATTIRFEFAEALLAVLDAETRRADEAERENERVARQSADNRRERDDARAEAERLRAAGAVLRSQLGMARGEPGYCVVCGGHENDRRADGRWGHTDDCALAAWDALDRKEGT